MDESTCPACGGGVSAATPDGLCPACLALRGLQSNTLARKARHADQWQPPSPVEMSEMFPELDRIELAGRGGMGAVYRARQRNLDRTVALKVLPPQLLQDAAFAARFAREAQALARLNHPNIVTIHDFGQRDDLYYFIMEFVDGPTLRQVITSGKVTPDDAIAIIRQVCDALQFAHEQGIVHRDIKPENVLTNQRGQVKIADFGLAKLIEHDPQAVPLHATTNAVGTPLYMAPEQIQSPQTVDQRADIYSLGVMFYELLTGELPEAEFLGDAPGREPRLHELVARAMSADRGARFGSVAQFRTALETVPGGRESLYAREQPTPRPAVPPVTATEPARASGVGREVLKDVRAAINIPSRGIQYIALANLVFLVLTAVPALISFVTAAPEKVIEEPLALQLSLPWWATGAFLFTMLSMGLNALVLVGGLRMRELRSYGLCVAAAILCLFAAPANVIGAVFGVWALVVLVRKSTRQAFGVSVAEMGTGRTAAGGGWLRWWPLARFAGGRKHPDLANYALMAGTTWLISYAMVSLLLLGRSAGPIYAMLLMIPSLAVPYSLWRRQRRLSAERLILARESSLGPIQIASRGLVLVAAALLYATANQSLAIRQAAEKKAAATQPAKPSVAERLHLTVPKIR